jgi:hypothetical protein
MPGVHPYASVTWIRFEGSSCRTASVPMTSQPPDGAPLGSTAEARPARSRRQTGSGSSSARARDRSPGLLIQQALIRYEGLSPRECLMPVRAACWAQISLGERLQRPVGSWAFWKMRVKADDCVMADQITLPRYCKLRPSSRSTRSDLLMMTCSKCHLSPLPVSSDQMRKRLAELEGPPAVRSRGSRQCRGRPASSLPSEG